jgi:FixJ family two-component response regulator
VIHVVDDDDGFRSAMARLLEAAGYEVRAYASAGDYLVHAPEDPAGCLLLDMMMPGPSGLELQEALARSEAAPPVVFLSGRGDVQTGVLAMKRGAVDFLTKPVGKDDLLAAVESALARGARERAARSKAAEARQLYDSLGLREREVLAGIVRGRLNKQIAAQIGTSERTVKAYRARVLEKMRADSIADLVRSAELLGLLADPPPPT